MVDIDIKVQEKNICQAEPRLRNLLILGASQTPAPKYDLQALETHHVTILQGTKNGTIEPATFGA